MLKIDAFDRDLEGKEFSVRLPPPFGPNEGSADITVKARPGAAPNVAFMEALEKLITETRVRDAARKKQFADDPAGEAKQLVDDVRYGLHHGDEIFYDHCILEWKTTIQSNGRDIEPTRENFLELTRHRHPRLQEAMKSLRDQVTDYSNFYSEQMAKLQEAEIKNS